MWLGDGRKVGSSGIIFTLGTIHLRLTGTVLTVLMKNAWKCEDCFHAAKVYCTQNLWRFEKWFVCSMLIHAVALDISLLKEIRQHPDQSVFFPHRPDIWNEPLMDIHGPYWTLQLMILLEDIWGRRFGWCTWRRLGMDGCDGARCRS